MLDRIRRRLTFANVMSSVAVFLSLSGGAYAVTAIDRNSVRSGHIANGEVRHPDLGEGSVIASKLRSHSVNSPKVLNDSLTGADVNESQLGVVPSAQDAASLGGIAAADYGRGFSVASDAIGYQAPSNLTLTVPGVGTVEMACEHGHSAFQDHDDEIYDIHFRNESGSPLTVVGGWSQSGGAGSAQTREVADGSSYYLPASAPSVQFRLSASELGANGAAATFEAGGEQLPNSDFCQGAIQAVKTR